VQLIATFLIVNGAADDIKKMKLLGTEAKGRGTANFLKKERGEHRCSIPPVGWLPVASQSHTG
jgi:hypothetical protein